MVGLESRSITTHRASKNSLKQYREPLVGKTILESPLVSAEVHFQKTETEGFESNVGYTRVL